MSAQRVEFTRWLGEAERLPWQAWLLTHGIDPNDVVCGGSYGPGWIERDEDARQVRYGAPDKALGIVERVVQLEAAPAPFPA